MAVSMHSPGYYGYSAKRRMAPRQRLAAWILIVGLHVLVLAALLLIKFAKPEQLEEAQTLFVSLISEQPVAAPTPPPPSAAPTPAAPTMIATPRPTMSAITAAPTPDPVTQQPAPPAPAPAAEAHPAPAPPAPAASIVPPNYSAAYLNNPGPQYPNASRRLREEGLVRLKVRVSAAGAVEQVLLDKSSGFSALDTAALDVVKRRWRFEPAKQAGQPVAAWVLVPLSFELKR